MPFHIYNLSEFTNNWLDWLTTGRSISDSLRSSSIARTFVSGRLEVRSAYWVGFFSLRSWLGETFGGNRQRETEGERERASGHSFLHCELIAARYFSISQPAGRPAGQEPRSSWPAYYYYHYYHYYYYYYYNYYYYMAGRYLASWPAGCRRNSRPGCPRCPCLVHTQQEVLDEAQSLRLLKSRLRDNKRSRKE